MLVLTRKKNEQIIIGDSITITVVGIDHGVVKLGVEAPKDIIVHRKEVLDKGLDIPGESEINSNNDKQ